MTDPTRSDIQQLVAYLPRLYGSRLELVRGFDTSGFGSYDYDPVVKRFYRLAGQECWCDSGYQPAEWFSPHLVNRLVKSGCLVLQRAHPSRRPMGSASIVEAFDIVEHISPGLPTGLVATAIHPLALQ